MNAPGDILTIGRYRVAAKGHSGGSATVHRIISKDSASPLALKIAHAETAQNEGNAGLADEYRKLSAWCHPQLCRVHDFGFHDDRAYLVCDWVSGPSLFDVGEGSEGEGFTEILAGLLPVLTFLHDRRWLHGDIKPDNLMWGRPWHDDRSTERQLFLLDMGLAGPFHDPARERGAGTVGYVAPEILNHAPADHAADWYSVGCLLYEYVFGCRPFQSDEPAEEIAGHLETAPDFSRPQIRRAPEYVTDLLTQFLDKNPDRRIGGRANFEAWLRRLDPKLDSGSLRATAADWHLKTQRCRLPEGLQPLVDAVVDRDAPASVRIIDDGAGGHGPLVAAIERELTILRKTGHVVSGATGEGEATSSPAHLTVTVVDRPGAETWEMSQRDDLTVQLLPQTIEGTAAIAREILGDLPLGADEQRGDETADAHSRYWIESLHEITSGLPGLVCDAIERALGCGWLVYRDGCYRTTAPLDRWPLPESDVAALYAPMSLALEPDERRVLDGASVMGLRFNVSVLEEAWEGDRDGFAHALARLTARGVLLIRPDGPTPSVSPDGRFRYAGLAQAWRHELPAGHRTRLATRMLRILDSRSTRRVGPFTRIATDVALLAEDDIAACGHGCDWIADRIRIGDHVAARLYLNVLEPVAHRIADQAQRNHWVGRIGMMRAAFFQAMGDLGEARAAYRRLLVLGRRTGQPRLLADAAKALGDVYKSMRRHDLGTRILRRALALYRELDDELGTSQALNNLGNMHWVAGEFDTALSQYEKALVKQRRLDLTAEIASTLSNIASIHAMRFEYDRARESFYESLSLKEKLGSPVETARTLNNLGGVAFETADYDTAREYFERAAALNRDAGARSECLINETNLLDVFGVLGDFRAIVTEGGRLLREGAELGHNDLLGNIHSSLARAFRHMGDFRLCRRHLEEARNVTADLTNDALAARLAIDRADCCAVLEDRDSAIAHLDEALQLTESSDDLQNRFEALWRKIVWLSRSGLGSETSSPAAEARTIVERLGSDEKRQQLVMALSSTTPGDAVPAADAPIVPGPTWGSVESSLLRARDLIDSGRMTPSDYQPLISGLRTIEQRCRTVNASQVRWRALLPLGRCFFEISDYEESYRALNIALGLLSEIAETIDDPAAKARYSASDDASALLVAIQRFDTLVADGNRDA